jgi:hypothetical protein
MVTGIEEEYGRIMPTPPIYNLVNYEIKFEEVYKCA